VRDGLPAAPSEGLDTASAEAREPRERVLARKLVRETLSPGAKKVARGCTMAEAKRYTADEAHGHFAVALNGETWELLEKPDRSKQEDERMIYAAHASCYHWLQAGTGVNHQRGEWLIARVYTVLGLADAALRHASRCLELTNEYAGQMKDFDWAFAYEGVARAHALAGNREEALKYIKLAEESGQAISNDEDRSVFMGDFNGGNWHGVK
jgi:tetratricopeptide (TPR) repeat protein